MYTFINQFMNLVYIYVYIYYHPFEHGFYLEITIFWDIKNILFLGVCIYMSSESKKLGHIFF